MLPSPYLPPLRRALAATLLAASLAACDGGADSAKLIDEARHYRQQGETKSAIIQLKNALQKEPDHAAARALLGELYLESSDVLSAEKELRRARELGMPAAQILPLLGKAMLMQGQYDKVLAEMPADSTQADILAVRAYACLGLDRLNEAARLFDLALQQRPGYPDALLGLARMALGARSPDRAMAHVEQALAKNPDDIDSLRLRGDLLRLEGKFDEARRAYARILELKPGNFQTRIDLANMHIQAGRFADARAEIAIARKAAPGNLIVIYSQALLDFREARHGAALEQLQQILRAAPDHMPSVLLAGAVQYALGANTQAEQHLRRFLETVPDHLYANKLLAGVTLKNGKIDEGIKMLAPLLAKYPDDVELLASSGEAYMRAGQFGKAAEYFQRASELAPGTAHLHTALGASRLGIGENQRAVAELERATGLDGKATRAGVLLVLTHMGSRDYAKALAAIGTMEKQGDNPALQNLKGGVLLASQNLAGARASFQQALALEPVYLPALENLAQLDLMEKKPDQARQRLEAALATDQKNIPLMTALAKLATSQGKNAEAVRWLERATRESPDALAPGLLLGHFYLRSGEVQKTLVLAQKLQASNPSHPDALALLAQAQVGAGHPEAALESYISLAVLQPQSPQVQLRIADLHTALGRQPAALLSLKKVLLLDPDNAEAQVNMVRLLVEKNALPEALAVVRAAQKRPASAALAHRLEGDVLMAQEQPAQALKLYDQAYTLGKSGPLMIAIHRALLKMGKPQDAAARMQLWLQQNPRDQHTRLYLASALLAERQMTPAIAQYETLIGQSPNHVVALNDLAWAYQQQKDGRALALAERAHQLAPRNAAVADTLGWILQEQGQHARALPLLKKASELAPASTDIRYRYALALMKTGDKAAARRQFDQLLATKDFSRQQEVRALLPQL